MADAKNDLIAKVADIPLATPGFDALNLAAPVMVSVNPQGKWEKSPPNKKDEKELQRIVEYLVSSKVAGAAQSYCSQCAVENQNVGGGKSKFVPVIMMPILPADMCPFDMECEVQKMMESKKKETKKAKQVDNVADSEKDKTPRKQKKRGFVLQRLTDFDLLSQW